MSHVINSFFDDEFLYDFFGKFGIYFSAKMGFKIRQIWDFDLRRCDIWTISLTQF